jgi:tetratricopeptide (TPR) repeat protein
LSGTPAATDSRYIEETFIVPYRRNPHFVGRKTLLTALRQKLIEEIPGKQNHCIALYGIGGVGKTQCALEYAYSSKDFYGRVYWISAVDQTSLFSGFQSLAKKAQIQVPRDGTPSEIAGAVLLWLKTVPKWLLIFDNLDEFSIISDVLPSGTSEMNHVLITTRNRFTSKIPAEPLEIPVFGEDDSINFFLSQIQVANSNEPSDTVRSQAGEIVRELGYLPLAIGQAAAFVREVTGDLSTYLEQYQKNRKAVLEWIVPGNQEYPHSVATTWSMCLQVLKRAHPQALRLLQFFAILNPDGIQLDFLQAGAPALKNQLGSTILDLIQLAKSLIELEKASLIRWERVRKSVSIHRLLQKVIRDEMSKADLIIIGDEFLDICLYLFSGVYEYSNQLTRSVYREYTVQSYKTLINLNDILQSAKYSSVLRRVGIFLLGDGKFQDSEALFCTAQNICIELHGPNHRDTLIMDGNLAMSYHKQGKWTEAARLDESVLEKMKRILGDEHPDTLRTMGNLARTYRKQRKWTEAARLDEFVLEKMKRIFGDEHPDTLRTMGSLATTYCNQGKWTEATRLDEFVMEKRKQILGDEHPDTLRTMGSLATTYHKQRKWTEAARLNEFVLEKMKRILGDEHPATLDTMGNLATTYYKQGKWTEAARLLEITLAGRMRILGDEHPDTLKAIATLAKVYERLR